MRPRIGGKPQLSGYRPHDLSRKLLPKKAHALCGCRLGSGGIRVQTTQLVKKGEGIRSYTTPWMYPKKLETLARRLAGRPVLCYLGLFLA